MSKEDTFAPYPPFPTPEARSLQVQEFLRLWSAGHEGLQADDPQIGERAFRYDGNGHTLYSATAAQLGDCLGDVLKGEQLHYELKYKSPYGSVSCPCITSGAAN